MARLRRNFTSGTITDNPLTSGATTINSAGFASLPTVASPDIVAIVLDPLGTAGVPEVAYVTAHTAAATSGTVLRGQETALGGSAGRQHLQGIPWILAETAQGIIDAGTIYSAAMSSWSVTTGYTDMVGASISLPAGLWQVHGKCGYDTSTAATDRYTARIYDATNAVELESGFAYASPNMGAFIPLWVILTLTATATIKLQGKVDTVQGAQFLQHAKIWATPLTASL